MTQVVEPTTTQATDTLDLPGAIRQVLRSSDEPLTVSKLRTKLPMRLREQNVEEELRRLVTAGTLHQFPKYRSAGDRYWDRPMQEHIKVLIRQTLQEGALAWSELRRKLPAYAQDQAESLFQQEIAQGRLHRHPRLGRGGDRFGPEKPDPKVYLRDELVTLFNKLRPLGFTAAQLRAGALELLHEEEWASLPEPQPKKTRQSSPQAAGQPGSAPQPHGGTPGQPT
jgi:hypothetical protein